MCNIHYTEYFFSFSADSLESFFPIDAKYDESGGSSKHTRRYSLYLSDQFFVLYDDYIPWIDITRAWSPVRCIDQLYDIAFANRFVYMRPYATSIFYYGKYCSHDAVLLKLSLDFY